MILQPLLTLDIELLGIRMRSAEQLQRTLAISLTQRLFACLK